MTDFTKVLERQELINKLIKAGHGDIVDGFLLNIQEVTTTKGRVNMSAFARLLGMKAPDLRMKILELREVLQEYEEDSI